MSEEAVPASVTGESPVASPDGSASVEAPRPAAPSWSDLLSDVSVDDLRRHPRVSGLVGQMLEARMRERDTEQKQIAETQARAKFEAELERQAREEPDEFANRWLKGREDEKRAAEIARERMTTRTAFAQEIGASLREVPGFSDLSREDQAEIYEVVIKTPEDKAIAVLSREIVNRTSTKRAKALAEVQIAEWKATELAKEREAMRLELAGAAVANGDAPDTQRGRTRGSFSDEPDFNREPAKWNAWYERRHLRR